MEKTLSEIKKVIDTYGTEIITLRRLVYILSDYGVLKDHPAKKRILLSIIDGGYSEEILHLSQNDGDASLKICSLISDMHNRYGYQIKKLICVFSWLTDGLGMKTIPYESILQVNENERIAELTIEGKHKVKDPYSSVPGYTIPDISLFKENEDWGHEESSEVLEHIRKVFADYSIILAYVKVTETPTLFYFRLGLSSNIRMTKLMYMQEEIANAIAPVGCRLIVPIPGTNEIGVEVPKINPNSFSLSSANKDNTYKKEGYTLPCLLGITSYAKPFIIDLARLGHLMINGAPKTGKSNCIHTVLCSLLFSCHPCEVKFVLIDIRNLEFSMYEKIASNFLVDIGKGSCMVNSLSSAVTFFQNIESELEYRKSLLSKCSASNIVDYDKKYMSGDLDPLNGHVFLPYIVIVVDELADVCAIKSISDKIDLIVKIGAAVGIHLIVSSRNRIKRVMMSDETKKGFQGKITFKQENAIDSKQIIDSSDALRLSPLGDFLYIDNSLDVPVRVSNAYVSMKQKETLIKLLSMQASLKTIYKVQQSNNPSPIQHIEKTGIDNKMLSRIVEMMLEQGKCTEAFLQKELSCTFNMAHRMLLQLDEIGITEKIGGVRKMTISSMEDFYNIIDKS